MMVMRATEMAVWQRQEQNSVLLQTDRGTQLTSGDYQKLLKRENLISGMSAVGHCANKADREGFFGVFKRERNNYR